MKKLMFIAIAVISLISVSNAFGQERRASSKTNIVKGTPWVIAADHGLSVKSGKSRGTTSNQRSRTRKPVPKSYKLLFFSENPAVKTSSGSSATDSTSRTAKQPRKRSTQKRQNKP